MIETKIDLGKIYEFRFQGIDQERRVAAWRYISSWIMKQLEQPCKVLEVGSGRCEFINQCGAEERYAVDFDSRTKIYAASGVEVLIGKLQDIDFGNRLFDAIFMSNLLEHLGSPNEVQEVFEKSFSLLNRGGKIGVLGPNFKYAYREYFDCFDHILPLTHLSVGEGLVAAGFENVRLLPKVLPFSFRSSLPTHPVLVKWYLSFPFAWKIIGKQFFIKAEKV